MLLSMLGSKPYGEAGGGENEVEKRSRRAEK
jgi:hypothetical protein